jgi:hypothetical protein
VSLRYASRQTLACAVPPAGIEPNFLRLLKRPASPRRAHAIRAEGCREVGMESGRPFGLSRAGQCRSRFVQRVQPGRRRPQPAVRSRALCNAEMQSYTGPLTQRRLPAGRSTEFRFHSLGGVC